MMLTDAIIIATGFACIPLAVGLLRVSHPPPDIVHPAVPKRYLWFFCAGQLLLCAVALSHWIVAHPLTDIGAALSSLLLTPPLMTRTRWISPWVSLILAVATPIVYRSSLKSAYKISATFNDQHIVVVVIGLAAATILGGVFVDFIFHFLNKYSDLASNARGLLGGSGTIGVLERTIVFGSVLVHHPEGAGLVVLVKSVARFPEFFPNLAKPETTPVTKAQIEKFIVGTLASILAAFVAGYVVLYVVK